MPGAHALNRCRSAICFRKHDRWTYLAVIAWLESMTRLDSSHDLWWLGLDSSHVEKNVGSTQLESCFSQNDSSHSQWLETRVGVIFTKSLSSWWTNPVRLHTNKWAFCASVMIKIGANFLFCLSSCAVLHFKDQLSPPYVEVDLRLCCHWGVSRAQYIDTLSWFNVVFAYRDHGSGSHTVTLSLFQIPVKWYCMSFKWLLRVLKGGRTKMLTSAKNNINILSLYKHQEKTDILNWNVFLLQTTNLHESLEGLNSSLAQSDSELLPAVEWPQEWLLRDQNFGQFLVFAQ